MVASGQARGTKRDGARRVALVLQLAAGLAMLSACETVAWQRPGTEPETVLDDLRACRWKARLRAQYRLSYDPQLLARGSAAPLRCDGARSVRGGFGRDPACSLGTPYIAPYAGASSTATRAFLESDFTDECMHGKGYTIEPVTQSE